VSAPDVLADLQSGGRSWETHVPEAVSALIKQRRRSVTLADQHREHTSLYGGANMSNFRTLLAIVSAIVLFLYGLAAGLQEPRGYHSTAAFTPGGDH
jgi:hypothetical protein